MSDDEIWMTTEQTPGRRTKSKADKIMAGILDDAADLVSGLDLEPIGEDGHQVANLLWKISGHLRRRR